MRDLTERALSTATVRGATYADVRIVEQVDESITVKSGRVEGVAAGESQGFGIRVLVDGAWGFASSNRLEVDEIDRVAAQAVRIAKASATALRHRVRLDDTSNGKGDAAIASLAQCRAMVDVQAEQHSRLFRRSAGTCA